MSGNTTNEGYPYPLASDFADVQDAFRLATAVDTQLRSEQAPFRALLGRPSFIARSLATSSFFQSGSTPQKIDAIDWDNTGGLTVGNFAWYQPATQGPSWWLFGSNMTVLTSGTPVVGDMNMSWLSVSSADPITGAYTYQNFYQRNDDSQTAGEWMSNFGIAAVYQGTLQSSLVLNGTTSKGLQANSRFWGLYLGPVNQ